MPAIYVTPAISHRTSKILKITKNFETDNYIKAAKIPTGVASKPINYESYVTPTSKMEKEKREIQGSRKHRASPPSTSYGFPLYSQALPSVGLSTSFTSKSQQEDLKNQQTSTRYLPPRKEKLSPPSTSYGVPIIPQEQLTSSNESNAIEETNTTQSEDDSNNGYQYPEPEGQLVVNKNIYFYKAPQDFEIQPTISPVKLPAPQKNYKVIFIKAPSVPAPAPVIQVAPQNEEKTLVYVLVKKPEEQPALVVPTPAPTQPSKPEVYFVKYSAQRKRVETAEKMYGVPQYGKGYYYGAGNNENVKEESESRSEESESKSDETQTNEYKILPQDEPEEALGEKLKKKRGSVRGVRSSSFSSDIIRNDLHDFNRYFASLKPRSRVYE